ncbi:virK protein [Salmonella enterica subsp. enterica serovar Typhimurium]|nr:virK protein [Salmonella enterica subsp. enterica serovar Typhimurium]
MPRATSQLLTNLTQWPELNTLLARQPRLPIRLHRPYMAVNIKRDFALDALCFHYQQMRQLLSREQQVSYLSQYGLNLAKFETKTGELFQLDLVSLVSLDKEGESTIVVRDAQLRILAEITFTLCRFNQQRNTIYRRITGRGKRRPSRNYPAGDQSLPWSFSQTHRDGGSLSVCASLSGRKDYSRE